MTRVSMQPVFRSVLEEYRAAARRNGVSDDSLFFTTESVGIGPGIAYFSQIENGKRLELSVYFDVDPPCEYEDVHAKLDAITPKAGYVDPDKFIGEVDTPARVFQSDGVTFWLVQGKDSRYFIINEEDDEMVVNLDEGGLIELFDLDGDLTVQQAFDRMFQYWKG